jgi:hypothetical protein
MSNPKNHDPSHCHICGCILDDPVRPLESNACGGDCLKCMAEVGEDPDCRRALGLHDLNQD